LKRRSFLSLAAAAAACAASGQSNGAGSTQIPVLHGPDDRSGKAHPLGVSVLAYKVVTADTQGALFVAEQMLHAKGGTPLHLHLDQDEWFYVLEGEPGELKHPFDVFNICAGHSLRAHRFLKALLCTSRFRRAP
jgi:hypothetical protein